MQNVDKGFWRENVPIGDDGFGDLRENQIFPDQGEQQHAKAFASWTVSQLEREWKARHVRDENDFLMLDFEVEIGGKIRE